MWMSCGLPRPIAGENGNSGYGRGDHGDKEDVRLDPLAKRLVASGLIRLQSANAANERNESKVIC